MINPDRSYDFLTTLARDFPQHCREVITRRMECHQHVKLEALEGEPEPRRNDRSWLTAAAEQPGSHEYWHAQCRQHAYTSGSYELIAWTKSLAIVRRTGTQFTSAGNRTRVPGDISLIVSHEHLYPHGGGLSARTMLLWTSQQRSVSRRLRAAIRDIIHALHLDYQNRRGDWLIEENRAEAEYRRHAERSDEANARLRAHLMCSGWECERQELAKPNEDGYAQGSLTVSRPNKRLEVTILNGRATANLTLFLDGEERIHEAGIVHGEQACWRES